MTHETSITIGANGKHYNIATSGKGAKKATKDFMAGKQRPLGGKGYSSRKEAVAAAKARSKKASPRHKK